ncbi:MAG TPA: Ig-like domain-containing protein [Bacteroidales bacterium]|nr:Ig-like domain-containing protein [Bacteroidales bacterium]
MKKFSLLLLGYLTVFSISTFGQLTTNLVSYWKLDETSGSTANDALTTNPGTVSGSGATVNQSGKISTAFSFDGTDDGVSMGNKSVLNMGTSTDFSISAWFKTSSANDQFIVSKYGSGYTPGYFIGTDGGYAYAVIRDGVGTGSAEAIAVTGTTLVNNNAWHLITATFDRDGLLRVYVDGTQQATGSVTTVTETVTNTESFCIGYRNVSGSYKAFTGSIDEVGIWNKVLTASEVTQLYNSGAGSAYPFSSVPVTGISVSPTTASISGVGNTTQLTATITPSNATNKAVTWYSNNPTIASVNSTGLVTGVAAGTITINAVASENGMTASSSITVQSVAVTGVSVSPTTASVATGSTTTLTATVSPTNATNKNVTWTSSNTSIATVNSSGVVTGVAAGNATITVTTQDGNKTATCAVTVSNVAVTSVSVSPTTASVNVGSTTALTATISPTNATNKTVTWSSNNTSIATVNSSTGVVTGVAAGSATITVTTQDGSKTATCAVTVVALPTAAWLLNGTNAYYLAGKVGILTANPTTELTVNGKILAKEVEVVSSIASDYVFEPAYQLLPLTDLEIYLKNNKHLPGIPSAIDFTKTGQNLGEMDDMLLRKIEELTLYLLQQNKKIEDLQKKIILLEKEK